jgi:hypothetical protein
MWYDDEERVDVNTLVGKTLVQIDVDSDEIVFVTSEGERYKMFHEQDCCESVSVDEVVGDWEDLLNSPLTLAEESTNSDDPKIDEEDGYSYYPESFTWTFYRFATIKGYLNVKWYGTSNGYYSESVSFIKEK